MLQVETLSSLRSHSLSNLLIISPLLPSFPVFPSPSLSLFFFLSLSLLLSHLLSFSLLTVRIGKKQFSLHSQSRRAPFLQLFLSQLSTLSPTDRCAGAKSCTCAESGFEGLARSILAQRRMQSLAQLASRKCVQIGGAIFLKMGVVVPAARKKNKTKECDATARNGEKARVKGEGVGREQQR